MVGPRHLVGVVIGCRAAVVLCGLLTGWGGVVEHALVWVREVVHRWSYVQMESALLLRWVGMEGSLSWGGDGPYGWNTLLDECCCEVMVGARSIWCRIVVRADRLGGVWRGP